MTLSGDLSEPGPASAGGETARQRRRKPRPAPASEGWTVRYAIGALAVVIVVGIAEGLALRALLGPGPLRMGISGLVLDATMLLSFVPLYRRRRFGLRSLGLRGTSPGPAVWLVFVGVIAVAITNAVWLQGVLGLKQPDSLGVTLRGSTPALVVAGLFVAVSAPVTEEIFFRGLLYRALRNRLSVPVAAAVAGILFGLVHGLSYPLDTLPPRMVFGVIACLLYERTGSLLPGIALHCLIDAGGFEVAVSGHNRLVLPGFVILGLVLLGYAAFRQVRSAPGPPELPAAAPASPARPAPPGPSAPGPPGSPSGTRSG